MAATIDFEAREDDMQLMGPGWPFGGVKAICCSVVDSETGKGEIYTDWGTLKERLKDEKELRAANGAGYDFGFLDSLGINIWDKNLVDSHILAHLFDSRLHVSLNTVLKLLFNEQKSDIPMALYALRHKLYTAGFKKRMVLQRIKQRKAYEANPFVKKRDGTLVAKKEPSKGPIRSIAAKKALLQKALKWTKTHMDIMYDKAPHLVNKYCIDDSIGCNKICEKLLPLTDPYLVTIFHHVMRTLIRSRKKGVRTDNKAVQHARDVCFMKESLNLKAMLKILGNDEDVIEELIKARDSGISTPDMAKLHKTLNIPNLNSSEVMARILVKRGYSPQFNEDTDRFSIDHAWLENEFKRTSDAFIGHLLAFRKYFVARNAFCDKIIKMNKRLNTWNQDFGRIYPQIKIFGADASGRMSGSTPNIQQMPSIDKDEEVGLLIRGCFVPEEGETWYTADWSAQEPRLQVHFGVAAQIDSATYLADMWKDDPYMDIHTAVALDMFPGTPKEHIAPYRKKAKVINLGLSYGMGKAKLYNQNLQVDWLEGEKLYNIYMDKFPYIKDQASYDMAQFKNIGYITTLLGRKIKCPLPFFDKKEKKFRDLAYKAFNYKIQGSGADMCYYTLAMCDILGIDVLFPVHDEVNISTNDIDKVRKLKHIMETGLKLNVPMVVELGAGKSWADACKNEVTIQ